MRPNDDQKTGELLPMKKRTTLTDVTGEVDVTQPAAVEAAVRSLFDEVHPDVCSQHLSRAFGDFAALYAGEYPGYHACETLYHDLQHSLDACLAMARLLHGHEIEHEGRERLGRDRVLLGIVVALFHDAGYIRRRSDTRHRHGAEYTRGHVQRSAGFLRRYLPAIGLGRLAPAAAGIVHYTGYEVPLDRLALPQPKDRLLGCMLGTADLLAQMSDRCYLEKCRDRLYPEFVLGGIARIRDAGGNEQVIFASPEHLLIKTPEFYLKMREKMEVTFGGVYRYATLSIGSPLYLREMENNQRYLQSLLAKGNLQALRRQPLMTPSVRAFDWTGPAFLAGILP